MEKWNVTLDRDEMETIHNALQVYMEHLDRERVDWHPTEGARPDAQALGRQVMGETRTLAYDTRERLVTIVGRDMTQEG